MSNDASSREIVDQAGSSSGSKSEETSKNDLDSMTEEEAKEHVESFLNDLRSQLGGEKSVNILLSYEEGGLAPNPKLKKFVLKADFPNIPFKTPQWQSWVSHCGV